MCIYLNIYHDRWWKQLNVATNLSFIRDRIVECHFWMTGACFEPQYSLARVISTKMTACITILDDIMDTYSTTEEAMLLAEAIYRYSVSLLSILTILYFHHVIQPHHKSISAFFLYRLYM
jgi:hypothetical protein